MLGEIETNYSNRASKEYFESLMDAYAPLSASDPSYLKKTRHGYYKKSIEEFVNMPSEEREELIDLLTDIVSLDPENAEADMEVYENLKEKIKKIKKYGQKLDRFSLAFQHRFEPYQQHQILKDAIIKINSNLRTIYKILKEDIDTFVEKDENFEFVLVSRQTVFTCIKLATETEKRMETTTKIDTTVAEKVFLIFILLLKLEAARRGKIDYGKLYEDLTLANTRTRYILAEEKVGSIYEVLNLET